MATSEQDVSLLRYSPHQPTIAILPSASITSPISSVSQPVTPDAREDNPLEDKPLKYYFMFSATIFFALFCFEVQIWSEKAEHDDISKTACYAISNLINLFASIYGIGVKHAKIKNNQYAHLNQYGAHWLLFGLGSFVSMIGNCISISQNSGNLDGLDTLKLLISAVVIGLGIKWGFPTVKGLVSYLYNPCGNETFAQRAGMTPRPTFA